MSTADEITKLASLRDRGILTEVEFETAKKRSLSGVAPAPSTPATKAADLTVGPHFEPHSAYVEAAANKAPGKSTVASEGVRTARVLTGLRSVNGPVLGLVGVVVLLVVAVAVAVANSNPGPSALPSHYSFTPAPAPPLKVVYKLTGSTNQASITYRTASGTSQQSDIDVPMMSKAGATGLAITGMSRGDFVYLSAQNSNEYGTLTCSIEIDGLVVATNTASGAYSIASCSGTA